MVNQNPARNMFRQEAPEFDIQDLRRILRAVRINIGFHFGIYVASVKMVPVEGDARITFDFVLGNRRCIDAFEENRDAVLEILEQVLRQWNGNDLGIYQVDFKCGLAGDNHNARPAFVYDNARINRMPPVYPQENVGIWWNRLQNDNYVYYYNAYNANYQYVVNNAANYIAVNNPIA